MYICLYYMHVVVIPRYVYTNTFQLVILVHLVQNVNQIVYVKRPILKHVLPLMAPVIVNQDGLVIHAIRILKNVTLIMETVLLTLPASKLMALSFVNVTSVFRNRPTILVKV